MIRKDIRKKILSFFLDRSTYGFSLRELERLSGVGLPSVKRHVLDFVKEELVKAKVITIFPLYFANRENREYKRLKVFHNVTLLYDSGVIDFINKELSYPTIVLFGSVAKGDDIQGSDIDLFIESPEKGIDLLKFNKKMNKNIQVFMHKNLIEVKNKHLMNNIINGITLEGFLEVFK